MEGSIDLVDGDAAEENGGEYGGDGGGMEGQDSKGGEEDCRGKEAESGDGFFYVERRRAVSVGFQDRFAGKAWQEALANGSEVEAAAKRDGNADPCDFEEANGRNLFRVSDGVDDEVGAGADDGAESAEDGCVRQWYQKFGCGYFSLYCELLGDGDKE